MLEQAGIRRACSLVKLHTSDDWCDSKWFDKLCERLCDQNKGHKDILDLYLL